MRERHAVVVRPTAALITPLLMHLTDARTTLTALALAVALMSALAPLPAQPTAPPAPGQLTRLLEAELARFPARTGVYVKHLTTGEEAAVRADDAFSSASVIKLTILVRAFQLVDQGKLNLAERVEIRRADLRDGSGVLQYHDLGQTPTIKDLLTEMVITSDNVATDQLLTRVGGVDALNAWLTSAGFPHLSMVARGHVYRRKILALLNPAFDALSAEETTGLQYAQQGDPLFQLYAPLFTGERATWVDMVRDPANKKILADGRARLPVVDRAYWLGDMTPRETGRLLEAIERGTIASPASTAFMRTMLRRQQAGARRIPHYLDVPVAHKTGDSPVIANDVGMVYARSGTVIIAFFANGVTSQIGEAEDLIGALSRRIVDYFDGAASPTRRPAP
jgi:beta-lactamase class A